MLKRKSPTTLATELTITGQGTTEVFKVVYCCQTQEQITATSEKASATPEGQADIQYTNRQVLLSMLESMESDYPLTDEGIAEMEADRPGIIEAMFFGYHQARRVQLTKN